ncbi:acyl-CoA dehydrogenase [Desulfatibacillum alkenivorans DSM 16219]|jgi:acyl-CoA dehydrogenase|uniref:Acyl-CoA dehydrogenase n=1 Tax=Desulfatibacillum alkenivorans DSM 16219 TaxID=1121393 RepID=A0A1M6TF57_9BACT|nr:acyl-CoA dehydrogenase family protein [Desulfatibacillum alkenivorans]SHK55581.1 acyl-CoA dehydrogenase [Desulfatibacillum alkenivorans DSM 16219]
MSDAVKAQEYFGKEHDMFRKAIRDFVKKEIVPNIDEWEEQGAFPVELYKKAAELGYIGLGFPEELGGQGGDVFLTIVAAEELMRSGSGGFSASLGSLGIALPPIVGHGTPEQKEKFVTPVLNGDRIAALGVTEPSGGSDVANLKTTAVRDGDHYVVNGSKTFITSGTRAHQLTTAVRTGGDGHKGISFLVIESDTPGYSTSPPMKKMGWWASDTAEIYFDNCRVPVENLIGEENKGFYYIMENFQTERLSLAVMANVTAQMALEECVKYVKQREVFGKPLNAFQVTRHKLVDMATLIEASTEFTYRVAAKMNGGVPQIKEVSMAKNFACQVADKVTFDAVQIFGGYGYMRGHLVERLYRDNRILSIGGGATEIMKEIISNFIM